MAMAADDQHIVVQRIRRLRKVVWHPALRRLMRLGGCFQPERLVWPHLVELPTELVKTLLLLQGVRAGRSRGFRLERPVHPLMLAVLLRVGRLCSLMRDAQSQPPGRQPGQSGQARRRERGAIVAADDPRQAMLIEDLVEGLAGLLVVVPSRACTASKKRLCTSVAVSG